MIRNSSYFSEKHKDLYIHMIPCRKDNYSYVIETPDKKAVMIDSSLKEPVMGFIEEKRLELDAILVTHHHFDHVDGIQAFQKKYDCKIYCSKKDSQRPTVKGKTLTVQDGDSIKLNTLNFSVLETHGHTKSHLTYYLKDQNIIFCGDTIFSLGCGRILEPYPGVFDDFFESFQKIINIGDDESLIYCAHEYSLDNYKFLESKELVPIHLEQVLKDRLKLEGKTVPSTLAFEKKYNAFLKVTSVKEFKKLRTEKDNFKI